MPRGKRGSAACNVLKHNNSCYLAWILLRSEAEGSEKRP